MERKDVILELVEDGWECSYGSLSFKVEEDMTIKEYREKQASAIEDLEEAGFNVSTYDSSINRIVLDLEIDGEHPNISVKDGEYKEE